METWSWVLVVVALVLLLAGSLRFDLLLPTVRERLAGRGSREKADATARGVPPAGVPHGHGAAAHTGHVAPHGPVRRRTAGPRAGKRH